MTKTIRQNHKTNTRRPRSFASRRVLVLEKVLRDVMVGGNHLASALVGWLGAGEDEFPLFSTTYEEAQKVVTDPLVFDAWVCWKTIMEAREAVDLWEVKRPTRTEG